MSSLVIKGGRLVEPTGERFADVVVEQGIVTSIGPSLDGDRTLDASGCVVGPGLVDLGCAINEPGLEEIERLVETAEAAALGGFTALLVAPEAFSVDSAAEVDALAELAHRTGPVEMLPLGSATHRREGARLASMGELVDAGVRCIGDLPDPIGDDLLARRVFEYSRPFGLTVFDQPLNRSLAAGGHLHEGEWSSRLGIAGEPAEAEHLAVMRDISLVGLTGASVHLQLISSASSVAMVEAARSQGLAVTASVSAAHLTLTDAACAGFDPSTKLAPPLRAEPDRQALVDGVTRGVISAVVSGHRPRSIDAKDDTFDQSPPGAHGLEVAMALTLEALGGDVAAMHRSMSWNPSVIAGVEDRHGASIEVGRPANICVIDPNEAWTVDARTFVGSGAVSPVHGRQLNGRVRHTLCSGVPVVVDGDHRSAPPSPIPRPHLVAIPPADPASDSTSDLPDRPPSKSPQPNEEK